VDLGAKRASTALRRALETAAPALDGWKRDEEPAALLQGLCIAAKDLRARLRTLVGHTAPVNDVAVTASGHLAVSASDDGLVRVVRLDTGQIVQTLRGHAAGVTCVALTSDARLVASGARDSGVIVWNPTGWDAPRRLIPAASSKITRRSRLDAASRRSTRPCSIIA